MRVYTNVDRTRLATGTNVSQPNNEARQICANFSEELFNLVKNEAIHSGVSMSEIIRQCVELVLK